MHIPSGFSPQVEKTQLFWKEVGEKEFICGPDLRHFRAGTAQNLDLSVNNADELQTLRLADGILLVRHEPREAWSRFGTGQCGACPRAAINIVAVDSEARTKPAVALAIYDLIGNDVMDMDIQMSRNWRRVDVYRQDVTFNDSNLEEYWKSEGLCLDGHSYTPCSAPATRSPPEPQTLSQSSGFGVQDPGRR